MGPPSAVPPAAPRPRVVVTDHDPVLLALLQEVLRGEGYEAVVPPEPDDPYPFVKAVRPAAVVLDAPFRQETAVLTTLDKLRLDPQTAAVPVVVCPPSPGSLGGLAGREVDGLRVLAKPFDLDDLLAALAAPRGAPPAGGAAGGRG